MQLQKAAVENMKTFPACWRANAVDHRSIGSDGRGSESSRSTSSGAESQSASDLFSSKCLDVFSPESAADCKSPVQHITATESCAAIGGLKIGSNPSTSLRKLNLDDYKQRHSRPSVMPVDSAKSTVVASRQESRKSLPGRSESAPEIVRSSCNITPANTSCARPRIKLKLGSKVVVKSVTSPEKPSTDVHTTCVRRETSFSSDVSIACVNRNASEKPSLLAVSPSVKIAGHTSSSSSRSCEDENSNLEPPSKRARMSLNRHLSSTAD